MSEQSVRVALSASVPPLAALWLWRRAGEMLKAAARFEERGDALAGRQLRFAYGQLEAAAAQVTKEALFPPIGNAEALESQPIGNAEALESGSGSGSERFHLLEKSMSVAEAANELEVDERQVRYWLHKGVLLGTQRARGSTWRVDLLSVADLVDERRRRI